MGTVNELIVPGKLAAYTASTPPPAAVKDLSKILTMTPFTLPVGYVQVKVGLELDPETVTFDAKGGIVTPAREPVVTEAVLTPDGEALDPLLKFKVHGPRRLGL